MTKSVGSTILLPYGPASSSADVLDLIGFDERLPDRHALGSHQGEAHAPADEHRVDLRQQVADDAELVRDLGPTQDHHVGTFGVGQETAEGLDLLDQQRARRPIGPARPHRPSRRGPGAPTRRRPRRRARPGGRTRSPGPGRSWSRPARSGCSRAAPPRPGSISATAFSTPGPTTWLSFRTGKPPSSLIRAATGSIANSGSRSLGRPRWLHTTTRARDLAEPVDGPEGGDDPEVVGYLLRPPRGRSDRSGPAPDVR